MSFRTCSDCNGSGYLNMTGRVEGASECCDYGGKFECDECGDTIRDANGRDRAGSHHLCDYCSLYYNDNLGSMEEVRND